ASFKTHNVATEQREPDSILNFYKRLIALRRKNIALREGEYVALNENDPNVLAYLRKSGDSVALVVLNLSGTGQKVTFDLAKQNLKSTSASTLLSTSGGASADLKQMNLEPFGVFIGEV